MQQNTKKILESFKNLNWKRQSAFLDILNDLLITTKPIKTDQSTFEKIMFDKALKDSGVTLEIDKNMSEEEKNKKWLEIMQIINWFIKTYNSFTKWRWIGIFVYNKEKDKLIDEVRDEYWYIDDKILKNIYTDRWFFIASLEELWFIEKINIDKELKNFVISLKKNKALDEKFSFDDLKEETKWFLKFSDDKAVFLTTDESKDKSYKKYIESMSKFFPFTDIVWESNEAMNNLKLFIYYEKYSKSYICTINSDVNI